MSDLHYQKIAVCHADSLLNLWADADVIRYTNMRLPCTFADAKARIARLKSWDVFVVIQNGTVIGIVGCLPIEQETAQYGLFYQFRKSSWGQGNASAATKWILCHMKENYPSATLFADVVVDNAASEKILQRFGFELILSEWIERDGRKLEVHKYRK